MKRYTLLILLLLAARFSFAQFITNSGVGIKNGARIITNGSWTNATGSSLLNNGSIETNQSFVNSGTLDPASTGGFILQFGTDTNFQPGGSSMGYLVKKGTGAALVANTLSIRDSLNLSNGLLHLVNASDTVSIRSGGTVTASASSYVEGMVARAGTGDLLFPVGRDGYYLPIKLYKAQAQKITATVIPKPVGYTPGPGVDSLINLPYAWKVFEKVKADTAAYVETGYPNNFPMASHPIVVRGVSGLKYASMGSRAATNSGGRITIRSYSRGLVGTFTVANGFPGDFVTDSLALVALYNNTNGASWTNKANWLSGSVSTWFGVTQTGQSITALNLSNNKLTGPVPDPLVDILALQNVNLSNNSITALPDFSSNAQVSALNVSNNKLTFASLEPNASVPGFSYLTQADFGTTTTTLVQVGSAYTIASDAGGKSSQFVWKRNGTTVPSDGTSTLTLAAVNRGNMGSYTTEVTNTRLPGLTLKSVPQIVLAYANVQGKLLAQANAPATKGSLTLFRVTNAAYDTISKIAVKADGSFQFDKVVLDDYQVLGFADTVSYPGSLPTYYKNTIYWEEADTLKMQGDVADLSILSGRKPSPSTGQGSINGYLVEDVAGGRTKKAQRVQGAGVSVRKVENTGRDKEERLTLVAYVFTDANGEFTLPNLPVGEYRINIQYPGYPMDETSFITIPIGTALKSHVSVEAKVDNGKINVRKLVITGTLETESYAAEVYPNPAVDVIHLRFGNEVPSRAIAFMNEQGKTMFTAPAVDQETTVNLQSLSKGIYFLRIVEKNVTVKTLKVSIE